MINYLIRGDTMNNKKFLDKYFYYYYFWFQYHCYNAELEIFWLIPGLTISGITIVLSSFARTWLAKLFFNQYCYAFILHLSYSIHSFNINLGGLHMSLHLTYCYGLYHFCNSSLNYIGLIT